MLNSKISQKENEQSHAARILDFLKNQIFYLVLVIIVIGVVATLINPNFLTLRNILNIMQQISTLGILTMVMSLLMVSGGLDISIGHMTGLIAIVFARIILTGNSIALGVIIALLLGTTLGFIN